MPSALGRECDGLADLGLLDPVPGRDLDGYLVQVILDRGNLGGGVIDIGTVVVDILHIGIHGRQATDVAQRIQEVQVPVAVPVVGAVDHEIAVALEEMHGIQRFHPGVVVLGEEGADEFTRPGTVLVQLHVVLGAVQDLDIDGFRIRGPADVRQEAFRSEFMDIQVDSAALLEVVDA